MKKIVELEKGNFSVWAAITVQTSGKVRSDVLEFLSGKSKADVNPSQLKGMKDLFKKYAQSRREDLTQSNFHHADTERDVLEFIKGRWRLLCFEDDEKKRVVIVSVDHKSDQKSNPKAVNAVVAFRALYNKGQVGEVEKK